MYNLCCISLTLKKSGSNHRAMRFTQFEKQNRSDALHVVGERIVENLQTTLDTMKFAKQHGWGYRISSTLFPLFNLSHADVNMNTVPNAQQIDDKLQQIQDFTNQFTPQEFRLSFHPDHFNVLCSENQDVIDRSIGELQHQGWLMDRMAGETSRNYWHPLNIHMSRSKGDPEQIAEKFIINYQRLNDSVKSRLVLENEDKGVWTPDMLFNLIHSRTGIPITFDNLHHKCNPGAWDTSEAFQRCASTWTSHDVNPLFHYSEGGANGNPRAHTEFAISTPMTFREKFNNKYTTPLDIDWDIEIKQKEYAIQNIQQAEDKIKKTI